MSLQFQHLALFRTLRCALVASATLVASAQAKSIPFDGCGTLVNGVTCVLFQPDSGGLWILDNYGAFVPGDYVRVAGTMNVGCISFCLQGDGCIDGTTITLCAICSCGSVCAGDGISGVACPCGNSGAVGHGCANSVNPSGALLSATGNSSLAADSVVLTGSGMPDSPTLYFQGTTVQGGGAGAVFGDGKRCAGGSIVRLGTKLNVGGASFYPGAGDSSVSVRGQVTTPGPRTYQVWYRNAAAFCTPSTFNLSNGITINWAL